MSEASSHKPPQAAPPEPAAVPSPAPPPRSSSRATLPDGQKTIISSRPPDLDPGGPHLLESATQWEGQRLGQFLLQEFVGGGGMGIVYRAHDTTLDREVAVKVLSRDQSADEETLRRFRNEAQSAARLGHENIARVFFVGEDRGVHYIVFEFIEGVNIRDLVEQTGPLTLEQAVSYTYQIALALAHASERSVIHRDIKPSNVLITPDGKAKLVDMGLARLSQLAPSGDLTASGVTLGTFDYISPEQARDPRSADVRSDLYSLGCSFYFMLAGRPPFPEGTVLQKLLQHQADTPPDPREMRPELPQGVSRILSRLLAKDPSQRYQVPSELIHDLVALGQSLGLQLSGSHTALVAPPARAPLAGWTRHVPWAAPLAALVVIVIGMDWYWSTGPDLAQPPAPFREVPPAAKAPNLTSPRIDVPEPEPPGPLAPVPIPPLSSSPPPPATTPQPEAALPDAAGDEPAESGTATGFMQLLEQYAKLTREMNARAPTAGAPGGNDSSEGSRGPEQGTAADLPPATIAAPAVPVDEHLLFVGDESGPGRWYSSLQAACSEARSGDTIELRYDGVRGERQIAITDLELRIRAGRGFRPAVAFRIDKDWNPLRYNRPAMVSVAGGKLVVSDVDWLFDLPSDFPIDWALFESLGCRGLDFEKCTFTIRGPRSYHGGAAFFEIKAPPGTKTMNMGLTVADDQQVAIQLRNCVARGEATLLRDGDLQPVELTWDNGLLATSERLFVADGNSLQPSREARAEIVLRHVTAMVGGGLVLLTNSEEAPYQIITSLECDDCIIATTGSAPLIEQRGSDGIDEYLKRFSWSGDHNYFDGFTLFWQIMNASGQSGSKRLDFDAWQRHWQSQSRDQVSGSGAVRWRQLPDANRPLHAHLPEDYDLEPAATDNAAVAGAADGSSAGGAVTYLPTPPAEPEGATEPATSGSTRSEP